MKFWEASQRIFAVPVFLIAGLLISAAAFSQGQPADLRTVHVKFKEQFVPRNAISGRSIHSGLPRMDNISKKHSAVSISRIFPEAGVYEAAHRAYGLHLWYEIKFNKDVKLQNAIADYKDLNYFHRVEECKSYTPTWETDSPEPVLPSGTNDPLFADQWHFRNTGQTGGTPGADINLLKAWETETGSPNVIVAVIDGGIDFNHPDLKDALWTN